MLVEAVVGSHNVAGIWRLQRIHYDSSIMMYVTGNIVSSSKVDAKQENYKRAITRFSFWKRNLLFTKLCTLTIYI